MALRAGTKEPLTTRSSAAATRTARLRQKGSHLLLVNRTVTNVVLVEAATGELHELQGLRLGALAHLAREVLAIDFLQTERPLLRSRERGRGNSREGERTQTAAPPQAGATVLVVAAGVLQLTQATGAATSGLGTGPAKAMRVSMSGAVSAANATPAKMTSSSILHGAT